MMTELGRNFPVQPADLKDPRLVSLYHFAVGIWDVSLDTSGSPTGPGFEAFDVIGRKLGAAGLTDEQATTIADAAYDIVLASRGLDG